MKVIVFGGGTDIVGHESDVSEADIHHYRNSHPSTYHHKAQEPSALWDSPPPKKDTPTQL